MQLICPLCRGLLSRNNNRLHCSGRHSFDVARDGYIHLLPVQKKRSRVPGDDKMMVAARRRFLDGGHYQRLSDTVNRQVHRRLSLPAPGRVAMVDVGCGEGYYGARLQAYLQGKGLDTDFIGVDISKFACRAAAKRNCSIEWLVASSSDIPVADQCADLVLCLFSPIQGPEFKRCLHSDGKLIVASTGPLHLLELRERLYDSVDTKILDPNRALAGQFCEIPQSKIDIQYRIELRERDSIQDLLAMTPHYWRAPAEKKNRLTRLSNLTVSVDIRLRCYSVRQD